MPRTATHGYLCEDCYTKYQIILGKLGYLIHHLRSIEKSGQALGERVSTSREPRLPIPETYLAADGLLNAIGERPISPKASIDAVGHYVHTVTERARGRADETVRNRSGAIQAVTLIRRYNQALARWPDSDAQRRPVPHTACPECLEAPLIRIAPERYGDDMLVACRKCDWTDDWFLWWEHRKPWIEYIRQAEKKK